MNGIQYEPEVKEAVARLAIIDTEIAQNIAAGRSTTDNVRFTRWSGQSPDCRKRREYTTSEPKPFEGATDSRIPLADMTIRFLTATILQAATRAQVTVKAMGSEDVKRAAYVRTLMRWLLRVQIPTTFRVELKKLCSYMLGDSPGVGVMQTWWKQDLGTEPLEITPEEVVERLLGEERGISDLIAQMGEEAGIQILAVLAGGEADEAWAWLSAAYPAMKKAEGLEVIKAWRKGEAGKWDEPYVKNQYPTLCALRVYDDIFLPAWTVAGGEQDLPEFFRREWISDDELSKRVMTQGYDKAIVEELLGDVDRNTGLRTGKGRGQTLATQSYEAVQKGEIIKTEGVDLHKNHHEIWTRFYREVDVAAGTVAIKTLTFSGYATKPLVEAQALDYRHGKYPITAFASEILGASLMDARGVSERTISNQDALKMLNDTIGDHTQVMTLPPIKRPKNRTKYALLVAPMGEIEEQRPGEVDWMRPAEYPRANDIHRQEVLRRHAEYFGMPNKDVPPEVTQAMLQDLIDDVLTYLKEVLVQMLQLAQQYMTDEDFAKVTGAHPSVLPRGRDDIQGQYHLELYADVRSQDMEYVIQKAKIYREMLMGMDTSNRVTWGTILEQLIYELDPVAAEAAIMPEDAANQRETDDEDAAIAKISAGVEPPMVEDGQNHALRLQRVMEVMQGNPLSYERMPDISREMLERRVQHHEHMVTQQRNAQIGRLGAAPVVK